MKSISTINPAINENTECTVVKVLTLVIKEWVCHLNTVYHYASFRFQLFEQHSKQRITCKAPLLSLHLPKSSTKALYKVCTANRHLRGKGVKYKGKQR